MENQQVIQLLESIKNIENKTTGICIMAGLVFVITIIFVMIKITKAIFENEEKKEEYKEGLKNGHYEGYADGWNACKNSKNYKECENCKKFYNCEKLKK